MENTKKKSLQHKHFTSIIILSYNTFKYTKDCIESIRRYTASESYEIIVVDNASKDETPSWLTAQPDVRTIFNAENVGFPKGCNQGMKIAKGSEILLLNSDTLVTENWLSNMLTALYSSKKIGAVGCLTNYCSNWQSIDVPYKSWDELQEFARNFNRSNPEKWWKWMWLVGFCMLFKREIYEKIGGLDEAFSPGNYEDDDYSLRIREAGYELMLCGDTFIHHYGSASFFSSMSREEQEKKLAFYNELLRRNRDIFLHKWGLEADFKNDDLEMLRLLKGNLPVGRILVLDYKLSANLYILARTFPGLKLTGVTSKERGLLLAQSSFDVIFCRNIEKEIFTKLAKKFDAIVYLDPILCNSPQKNFLQKIADAFLDSRGTLFYMSGGNLYRINKTQDKEEFIERKGITPMILTDDEAALKRKCNTEQKENILLQDKDWLQIGKIKLDLRKYNGNDAYSDGSIEDEMLEIAMAGKIDEILKEDNRWPIFYHFSKMRENLLGWYPFEKNARILEIGMGCGAVTGGLAEKVGEIDTVELSLRRAKIAAYRHQDKGNITIHVGNLNDMELTSGYDYVTLIGVLEYAGSFTKGEDPYKDFLKKCFGFLRPGGKLVIAIENRLGLKYWAGAPEDHLGRPFVGIEGYKGNKRVQTFSRPALEKLVQQAGGRELEWYYPYPDYKLPEQIYSETEGSWDFLLRYPDIPYDQERYMLFDEWEAMGQLQREGLGPIFANSFLVFAKKGENVV